MGPSRLLFFKALRPNFVRTLADPERIANRKGVLVLLRMSSKLTDIPLGFFIIKNLVTLTPSFLLSRPNSLAKPLPNCTNSNFRSNIKCQGNALQNVGTLILRSSGDVDMDRRRPELGKADFGVIKYLKIENRLVVSQAKLRFKTSLC